MSSPVPDQSSDHIGKWDEIVSLARTYQYDRYIAATLSPRAARHDLITLAAFAGEMRRIPWSVSEPTIGMIRLQWWRDGLTAAPQETTGNPLADAVRTVVARNKLPVGLLLGHIDAQELELYADLVEDMDQLRLHYIRREGGLFQLAAQILGQPSALDRLDQAACAYGMAKSIAEFAFRRNGRQLLVPGDMAASYGIKPDTTAEAASDSNREQKPPAALLSDLADIAMSDYRASREALGSEAGNAFCALLPLALTPAYASTAKSPFAASNVSNMGPGNFSKSCRLLWAYMRGRL
ncbi:MAG: squalene/phytoene synthase family protein [Pseudomonadota bacterium]